MAKFKYIASGLDKTLELAVRAAMTAMEGVKPSVERQPDESDDEESETTCL